MTPEQALLILKQALVTRQGLSLDEAGSVIVAWNVIAGVVNATKTGKEQQDSKLEHSGVNE